MPTHLFNPCAPHDDAVNAGVSAQGQPCGLCVNVPRAWQVTVGTAPGIPADSSGSATLFLTDFHQDGDTDGVSQLTDSSITALVAYLPTANSWWQFLNAPIPKAAKITAATLTLTLIGKNSNSADTPYKLTGSPSSSQAEPTAAGWYGLARTTTQVTGIIPFSSTIGTAFTFDVTQIVQEIVRGSWTVNGSLMFFMDGEAPTGGGGGTGVAWHALDSNASLPFTDTSLSVSWAIDESDYAALFAGTHVLIRDVDAFEDNAATQCQWSCPIDLSSISSPGMEGSIQIIYTSVVGDGGGAQWFLIFAGLPAIGASPADVTVYKLNAFAFSPIDNRPFRCLTQNTFWREDLLGGGNMPPTPDSVLLQPFWP